MSSRLTELFLRPLTVEDGVYSPVYDKSVTEKFLSPHYATDEGVASQTFNMEPFYLTHLERVFELVKLDTARPDLSFFEIGCGFGSATIPMLKLLPQSYGVASELSLPMIRALRRRLGEVGLDERLDVLQLNAEELDFKPGSFDIIVGAAILHHLLEPGKVVNRSFACLKPGGFAVFFEPFENGYDILGLMHREILAQESTHRWSKLTDRQRNYLIGCTQYWTKMKTADKSSGVFHGMDDKWLFSRSQFKKWAEEAGYSRCDVEPIVTFDNLVKSHAQENGLPLEEFPAWAREIVDFYVAHISKTVLEDFLTEGIVILRKDQLG